MAPRRAPVERIVPHIASHTCMNDTGPEAIVPTAFARVPRGRKVRSNRYRRPAASNGALFQGGEDAGDRVLDGPHHEAIEERDIAFCPRAGLDAAAWEKLEILQNVEEALFPSRLVFGLDHGKRMSNTPPALGDRTLSSVAVLRRPDAPRDLSAKCSMAAEIRGLI